MKEAQGLESELGSLARRKSDLEDAELEVMERLEEAEAAVAAQEALIADTNAEGSALSAEAKRVVAEATAAFEAATRDRAAVAGSIAPDLLAYYDRVAARSAGAALLRRGTCEGCRMVLAGTDMQAIRLAPTTRSSPAPSAGASSCARRSPVCDPPAGRRGRRRLARQPRDRRRRRGRAR